MTSLPAPREGSHSPVGPRVEQLKGFRIGVTSDRRSDDLIAALERRGAQVLHAPALKIAPNDQDGPLIHETRVLIDARPDVVLVTTGYGMRRWFEVADAAGLGAELTAVLDEAVILARGPKALGSVRAAGLDDAVMSDHDTTASLVDKVADLGLLGRRVAIQLHGHTDEVQLRRLEEMSSCVLRVTPYRWVSPARQDRLAKLIEATCQRHLDAITFTSAPGADATLAAAEAMGLRTEFVAALQCDVVAVAVGPVTATPLTDAGARVLYPDRHRLGALIRLVCEHLDQHRVERFVSGENLIELRGRALAVNGERVLLGPNALALFKALARAEGVVPRSSLLQVLPDEPDDHALEVAVSRLRRALGIDGLISTVVRRGYRLNAERILGLH